MAFSELEIKKIEKLAQAFLDKRRPPVHLRKELDLGYRIDGNSIVIFEIRPFWKNPKKQWKISLPKRRISKKVISGKFTGKVFFTKPHLTKKLSLTFKVKLFFYLILSR